MQVDLSQNSLEKDAKVLLKSAAQAANCMLILDDSDREGEETLETQERTEKERKWIQWSSRAWKDRRGVSRPQPCPLELKLEPQYRPHG